jgi:hypothetical protein
MPVVAAEALAAKVVMPIAAASKVAVQRCNIFLIFIQFLLCFCKEKEPVLALFNAFVVYF